jgi:dipeptidyl aminopeptidase/acylaminoacyl peptidase
MFGRVSRQAVVLIGAAVVATTVVCVAPTVAKPPPASNGLILFLSNSVLTTVNPDGTHPNALISAQCARWSPNGGLIATCGPPDGVGSTLLVDPLTGNVLHELFPLDPTLFLACYVWSQPDGARLACEIAGPADQSRNGLYTVRASDGGDIQPMTSNPGGTACVGDYSPDGTRFVFSRMDPTRPPRADNALFVVNVDGSGLRQITPSGFPLQDCAASWSPNGNWILFDSRQSKIFLVHPDGTDLHAIPLAGITRSSFASQPSWSPDGTKFVFVLFTSTAPGTGEQGIYTANADGSNVQQVSIGPPGSEDSPDWGTHALAGP